MASPEEDLVNKRYRYFAQNRTGIANDSRGAELEAQRAAGIFPQQQYAYQTATPAPAQQQQQQQTSVPLASGGNAGLISQVLDYQTGVSKTTYGGVPAFRIDVAIGPITLGPGNDLANPIDVTENGVLLHYSVAVNDPGMKITSILYGDNNSQTTLWDDSIEAITYLGRGMTQGQAQAVNPGVIQYSLDPHGTKDDAWPWIQRYRCTYSRDAMTANLQYDDVAGTKDDIWLVAVYTPELKEGYSRVYLNVKNTSAQPRMILKLQMSRYKFQPTIQPTYTSASGD
jgi:hypothetical protein